MALGHQFETLDPRTTSEWNCEFTNYRGNSAELSAIISQMSIYESIYNNCMFGNIKLYDGTGLIENHGVIGSGLEKFHFEILTENTAKEGAKTSNLEKIWNIDSVSKGHQNEKFTEYDIGIVSPYLHVNNKTKISRSFLKMTSSKIVEYVGAEILKFEGGAPNWASFDVTPTLHEKNTVVPNWNPFQLINFLAKNSVSADGSSNYLFFENNEGFKFTTVDDLMKKPVSRLFALKNMPTKIAYAKGGLVVDDAMMTGVSEEARFNIAKGQTSGQYGSSILTHNILEKRLDKYEVIYDGPKDKIMAETIGLNGPEAQQFADFNVWQHSGFMSDNYLYQIHDKGEKSHYPLYDQKQSQLRTNVIKFDVPGDSNVFAGDVIQLRMPTHIHNHDLPEDQYVTGKWLITAIHHKINNNSYEMTLECMKDGFFTDPDVTIPARTW
ncbi:MAG: hypothetical protein OR994_04925 [Candidatus Poseidoniales archaeon]|nr:hypothetical protein [Candidatus Poseidoniales archaeon]